MIPVQVLRFKKPLELIREIRLPKSSSHVTPATLQRIVKSDWRGKLFQVEGLLRIYSEIYGKDLEAPLAEIKEIEDTVGRYTEAIEYLAFAESVKVKHKGTYEVLENDVRAAELELIALLPKVPGRLARLEEALENVDWSAPKKDKDQVLKFYQRALKSLIKEKYDMTELQEGIHEARRDIRWLLIYIHALDGLIQIKPATGKLRLREFSYLEKHPIAEGKHSKVPDNDEIDDPFYFPAPYFLAVSKVVSELGDVKSVHESMEALASAFLRSGKRNTKKSARDLAEYYAKRDPHWVDDPASFAENSLDSIRREKDGLMQEMKRLIKRERR